jgi:NADH-quinone oxidoreductase subunit H
LLSLIERKTLARVQNRIGPNRAGPFGILQPVADGIKMLTKEDIVPDKAEKFPHLLAPVLVVVPAILALGVLPLGRAWVPVPLEFGLLFFFAVGSMTELSIFMAGWASGSKFPLLGALRALAQMMSYEIPLVLSSLGAVMMAGSLSLVDIVEAQGNWHFGFLPSWNLFTPWGLIGGLVFAVSAIAESNRTPFDLPEGESEIVAGHMTEYSGFKYALFFMGEYLGLFAISGLGVTLFLGGWNAPSPWLTMVPSWCWFFAKLAVIIFVFLWIRATWPRVRIDQLLALAWRWLIPSALLVIPATAIWKYTGEGIVGWLSALPVAILPTVFAFSRYRKAHAPARRVYRFAE